MPTKTLQTLALLACCPLALAAPADLARLTDNPDAHRGRWQWQETG